MEKALEMIQREDPSVKVIVILVQDENDTLVDISLGYILQLKIGAYYHKLSFCVKFTEC